MDIFYHATSFFAQNKSDIIELLPKILPEYFL